MAERAAPGRRPWNLIRVMPAEAMETQPDAPSGSAYDLVVVGGGIVGLSCAWRAAQQGAGVLCVERDLPGSGASGVAAGMLAPVTEADFGEEELLTLNLESRELWPGFAAELEELTALPTGYADTGALVVAADRDDAEELRRLHEFQRTLGLQAEWLTPRAARTREPGLSPRIFGAIAAPQDGQVDPAAVMTALARAVTGAGGELLSSTTVEGLVTAGACVSGVRLATGTVHAPAVLVAAGAWSGDLAPGAQAPAVRPVKGQLLELRVRRGAERPAQRVIRTPRCYVVTRPDGRVVVGATMEEQGFDTSVTADGVFRLLEAAYEVLPGVAELELVRARAGLRPVMADNRPVIGAGETEGLLWATGHGRNGVLLAPLTAKRIAVALRERAGVA